MTRSLRCNNGATVRQDGPHPTFSVPVDRVRPGNRSLREKRESNPFDTAGLVPKCPRICCDPSLERPTEWAKSCSDAVNASRTMFYIDATEAARTVEEIGPVRIMHSSCQKELQRLRCMLAARRPHSSIGVPHYRSCSHACCSSSLYPPPRTSPEWCRLHRVVQQLQLRHRDMSRYLVAKQSLLAPIRRLPPELLQQVFMLIVISDTYGTITQYLCEFSYTYGALLPGKAVAAVRLAHVCCYWRAVALNTRELWSTIILRSEHSQFRFYLSLAKTAPLTVFCSPPVDKWTVKTLVRRSRYWRTITLDLTRLTDLEAARQNAPLLQSLCLRDLELVQTIDIFRDAPSLRRLSLKAVYYSSLSLSKFIAPWKALTSLTLNPIATFAFSECIQICPRDPPVEIINRPEPHCSLRKLVISGQYPQETVIPYSFPHLLSLSIEVSKLHGDLSAFLARSSHLEMLVVGGFRRDNTDILTHAPLRLPVELRLATPSLRILHLRSSLSGLGIVTPEFHGPLVLHLPDDPFVPRATLSEAELEAEVLAMHDEADLAALIE
ncbi:hypothetical protein R3P38DRAFT_2970731 [Favolaschia claudopus]|uniref:F-box domain-containing protein n=1 Tax=Favolaschia claudopus TaxID=2862362 RepID=A0AAW0B3D4_9AGAR